MAEKLSSFEPIPFDITKAKNCSFCAQIPFHQLPHEEDAGLAHHKSYRDLKLSAESCTLCHLLVKGIYRTRTSIAGDRPPAWMLLMRPDKSRGPEKTLINGAYTSGGTYATGRSLEEKEAYVIPDLGNDTELKPWLYGNWYVSDVNEKLLIGMGIRLGYGPGITEAEFNTKERVSLRGSQLRLRTADSKTPRGQRLSIS
jgi:hypothetical protein